MPRPDAHAAAAAVADGADAGVSSSVLTPLSFLERSADVWAQRPAVAEGVTVWTYTELHDRARRAARALAGPLAVAPGDRVAVLMPNVAPMLELHFAVPGAGGVLVPLNTRLAARDYAYILEHSGARLLFAERSLADVVEEAAARMGDGAPRIVWIDREDTARDEYESLLRETPPAPLQRPDDERALLSINYTSGTTGRPKGVMTAHRGAYLHSLGVVAEAALAPHSVYLWTLPMFHCNGWAYTWAVTAMGSLHVCLPKVDPELIWRAMVDAGVTHLCAAPTVVSMMLGSAAASRRPRAVRLFIGGAPPAPALLQRAADLNIEIVHLYGLTETYGPLAVCAWNPDWDDLPAHEQARLRARQGVGTVVTERLRVVDEQMRDVPRDGRTMGEIVMRGNNVMLGYYRDEEATRKAFEGGWFHSGDLGVVHDDGYIEIRDRLKDIVISGGENIATVEVEQVLMEHDAVAEAAVVGAPDARWGEVPVAFVTTRAGQVPSEDQLRQFAGSRLASFKVPKRIVVVGELPKSGTGKILKYRLRERGSCADSREGQSGKNSGH